MGLKRDHGGGLDAARATFGGDRAGWIDLSTGINPEAYPVGKIPLSCWTELPDEAALTRLLLAARRFWQVPDDVDIVSASGASALIAQIPTLAPKGKVAIPSPTYNEHAAAFETHGWRIAPGQDATAQVVVHPNNPDGRSWYAGNLPVTDASLTIVDESFCDVTPDTSLVHLGNRPGTVILKSFGKFWGLAGLRLGFAIGDPDLIAALRDRLGPWAVSGPASEVGAKALEDPDWAVNTRHKLSEGSRRLDALMEQAGAQLVGGTTLFRLYEVDAAQSWQERLARHHIWSRTFPYNAHWLRLGLPPGTGWDRLEAALQ